MADVAWERVKDILGEALAKPPEAQHAFVDHACGGDEALRQRIVGLLRVDATAAAAFSADPAQPADHVTDVTDQDTESLPTHIGRYRILRMIDSGGMGTVYEAEQENPRRRIAVKVLSRVWSGSYAARRAQLARFRHEGELLGRLQHPGIARIYEAGIASDGGSERPFLAMELIRGVNVVDHARERGLNVSERVALLAQICDAVHAAHVKGIIHCDLKPENILVDEDGQARVVDFGVARSIGPDAATLVSAIAEGGEIAGTLPYMSPEQFTGRSGDVDSRSDVYALGAIMYTLLAGLTPHDVAGRSFPEAVRRISDEEPRRLSALSPACRGDLDAIAGCAIAREPGRRYQSAAELAADLRRYLRHEAVIARAPSAVYQLHRLVGRNRALAATLSAAALALAVTGGLVIDQAGRARREAQHAAAFNLFLQEILGAANPYDVGGPLTVLELLDHASARAAECFEARPLAEADARETIGKAFFFIGDMASAEEELRRCLAIRSEVVGPDQEATLEAMSTLGRFVRERGRFREAIELLEQALRGRQRRLGPDDPRTLTTMHNLGLALFATHHDNAEAERLIRHATDGLIRQLGAEHPEVIWTAGNTANFLTNTGRAAEAEPLLQSLLERSRRINGEVHPRTLLIRSNYANALYELGRTLEVEKEMSANLRDYEATLGLDHPHALLALEMLGMACQQEPGRMAEAERYHLELFERRARVLGPGHPRTGFALMRVSVCQQRRGAVDEAAASARQLLEIWRSAYNEDDDRVARASLRLARALVEMGKQGTAEALALSHQVKDLAARKGWRDDWFLRCADIEALALLSHGHADDASSLIGTAIATVLLQREPPRHAGAVAMARATLGRALLEQGRYDEARAQLEEAYEFLDSPEGCWAPILFQLLQPLAFLAERRGDPASADRIHQRILELKSIDPAAPMRHYGGAPSQ
jgi:eukaryotic-like serine/threonine-protein kinase